MTLLVRPSILQLRNSQKHRWIWCRMVYWWIEEVQTNWNLSLFPQHLIIHIFLRINCNDNIHQQSKFPYSQNPDRPPIPPPKVLSPLPEHSSSRFHRQAELIPWVLVTKWLKWSVDTNDENAQWRIDNTLEKSKKFIIKFHWQAEL